MKGNTPSRSYRRHCRFSSSFSRFTSRLVRVVTASVVSLAKLQSLHVSRTRALTVFRMGERRQQSEEIEVEIYVMFQAKTSSRCSKPETSFDDEHFLSCAWNTREYTQFYRSLSLILSLSPVDDVLMKAN